MVEHLPHYLKVEDSNPATTAGTEVLENGKSVEKDSKCLVSGGNRVVEHLPHHSKVKDLCQVAAVGTRIEKLAKMLIKNILNVWLILVAPW